MAKEKKRRRSSGAAAFPALTGAAIGYGVARYRNEVLKMLPHGFESATAGQGKKATDNKRVLIVGALALFTATNKNKRIKRWAPFAGFLLGAAIQQHRMTYQGVDTSGAEEFG